MLKKLLGLINGVKLDSNRQPPEMDHHQPLTTASAPISCSSFNQADKIFISQMPPDLRERLENWALTRPGLCYHNCFGAVIREGKNGRMNLSYVLGWVTHDFDGKRTEHAWLKQGDKYYDPTLEPQNLILGATYEPQYEFSIQRLTEMLLERFGEEHVAKMMKGKEPWWPLTLTKGGYGFADV